MADDLEPLVLMAPEEPGERHHMLYLRAADVPDDVVATFEASGEHAGGYGWEKVARQLLGDELAGISDEVEFNSESDTFVAVGEDRSWAKQMICPVCGSEAYGT